jgi:hypothetical protein
MHLELIEHQDYEYFYRNDVIATGRISNSSHRERSGVRR